MLIKGFQKTTLLDFPQKIACTVFTGGCNFRCPFCHNASLVTHISSDHTIDPEEILSYVTKRKGILDGVCITGGEPTLQPDLADFCREIHARGLLVKLDTNGAFPEKLAPLMEQGLIDYIAMDIKNSKEEYARTCGLTEFPQGVEESIRMIMSSGIPYEFRTTAVREFHTVESIRSLAQWISGAEQYFLQAFTDSGDLIGEGLSAFSENEMRDLLSAAIPFLPNAKLRGI